MDGERKDINEKEDEGTVSGLARNILFGAGAFLISLTVSYFILEVGASFLVYKRGDYLEKLDKRYHKRLIAQDPPGYMEKELYDCDPRVGAVQTPSNRGFWRGFAYPKAEFRNHIFINADGFRSSQDYGDIQGAKVAVVGDSFVQGFQVREQDTFVKVAETALRGAGRDVSVLNYGECGTGTALQSRIFEEYVLKRHPQVVVLSFYTNDLTDNAPSYEHEQIFLVPHYTVTPSGEFILKDFQCEGDVDEAPKVALEPKEDKAVWRAVSAITKVLDKARFSIGLRYLSEFLKDRFLPKYEYDPSLDVYKKVYPPKLEEALRFTLFLIEKMHQRCEKEGIKFLVMLIPSPEQANPAIWRQYVRSRGGALPEEDFDLKNPQQELVKGLAARGIPVLDLGPHFIEQSRKETLYYPKDRHFNVNGHRLTGELLSERLRQYLAD